MLLLLARQAVLLFVQFWFARGLGTLLLGEAASPALRTTLGLAVFAQLAMLLAVGGLLTAPVLLLLACAVLLGLRHRGPLQMPVVSGRWVWYVPWLIPALYLGAFPPFAFDETMYHLPFVRSFAQNGGLSFVEDMRFPAFATLHELLCIPVFMVAGDVATHTMSLLQVLLTAWLLLEWRGGLAAALFVGSPIAWYLSAINYVDAGLTLFVAAGFYCLEQPGRRGAVLAGLFFGTAYGLKYLGAFFVVCGFLALGRRGGSRALYVAGVLAGSLPTALWLVWATGNPLFPYATRVFGDNLWAPKSFGPVEGWFDRLGRWIRLAWDVSFCREGVNQQPAITPFLIPCLAATISFAMRKGDRRAATAVAIVGLYSVLYLFLPRDSRYLVPLLPLLAAAVPPWRLPKWCVLLVLSPGPAYGVFHMVRDGLPPSTAAEREAWLERRVPEYRGLKSAGTGAVYVAGGEQLKAYAQGRLAGDHFGTYSYARVLGVPPCRDTRVLAGRLRPLGFDFLLVCTRVVPPLQQRGGLQLVYDDRWTQLWKVP